LRGEVTGRPEGKTLVALRGGIKIRIVRKKTPKTLPEDLDNVKLNSRRAGEMD
jgi:hypothetical protein